MIETLPTSVKINGREFSIRNRCDYRVVLDAISALHDDELNEDEKLKCALYVFYDDATDMKDYETVNIATKEMLRIINNGNEEDENANNKQQMMDWEHDFHILVAPINRVLGCEIRSVDYLHWWTFLSGYMEIGECLFSNVLSIRKKKLEGKKLEKWEQEFYRGNKKIIDLPQHFTEEEKEWLDSDW